MLISPWAKAQIVPQYNDLARSLTSVKIRQSAIAPVPDPTVVHDSQKIRADTITQCGRHGDVIAARHTFLKRPTALPTARSLPMDFLWSLFSLRRRHRHYARVDKYGICVSFKHCAVAPQGHDWVEITEANLSWLHQPLPASARVTPRARAITARQLLSI
jgi:hypothetical protein